MEQRLDATYLRHGPFERTVAVGIGTVGVGMGILLAAWGISFLWRYTPPEIRIANPELHVAQDSPLKVTQDKPFMVATPEPLKIDPPKLTVSVEQSPHSTINEVGTDTKTAAGDTIKREVTVFSNVRHGQGAVVTGWNYRDGSGGTPVEQYCYYTAYNPDHSSERVDIAADGVRLLNIGAGLVPDLEEALGKCQWWQG
jgi:hypothetical protein